MAKYNHAITLAAAEPYLFVDGICIGCKTIRVHRVREDAKDWRPGRTFRGSCVRCRGARPHNITNIIGDADALRERLDAEASPSAEAIAEKGDA